MADLIAAAIALGAAAFAGKAIYEKAKRSPGAPVPGGQTSGAGPVGQDTGPSGPGPGTVTVPPPTPAPLAPGVYPPNTPGALAVQLIVQNSDGNGILCATPGGCQSGDGTATVWYGPGTQVDFQARVQGFAVFTGFDHFEGPGGAQTRQNPFVATIQDTGYVKAVYAFLGVVSG